jgi:hypothetical protein
MTAHIPTVHPVAAALILAAGCGQGESTANVDVTENPLFWEARS